ncbi:MAG TPA: cache domain-containing protein, partial [Geobacterales bacterium]|nr:cache domain-containing protein [Geobacterales bacterium]
MRVPIKYKLASIVAIILIPLLLTAGRQYLTAFEARHAAIEAETRSQADSIARVIDQEILSSFRIAETLTNHPAFINHDTPSCDRLAARLIQRFDNHLNILAADMAGNNYCSAIKPVEAHRLNYMDKEWFTRAAAGERVVGDMHLSKLFKSPSVMISLPIRNARDKQVGVIGFPLDLNKVSAYLTGISHLPKGAVLLVVDNKSVLLIDSLHPEHVGEKISSPLMRAHLNSDASGLFSEISLDNKQRLFGYATVSQSGWKVLVGYPSSDARHAA